MPMPTRIPTTAVMIAIVNNGIWVVGGLGGDDGGVGDGDGLGDGEVDGKTQ